MKKFLFSAVTLAAAAFAVTSCSQDAPEAAVGGDKANVTLTTTLPDGMGTRAFADGQQAKDLVYAVYESGSKTPLAMFNGATKGQTTITTAQTVNLQLATGKKYDVVFFASATGTSFYTFDEAAQTVKVNNTDVAANDDTRDAFFVKETIEVTGDLTKTITLTRPFAQLNIGTDDFEAAKASGNEVSETQVKVKGATTLNFDGSVADEADYTFTYATLPADTEAFPVSGYKYLTMNYVLVGKDAKTIADVTLNTKSTAGEELTRTYSNVPLQGNYRTNIYGSLLTSTATFNVVVDPAFKTPDYSKSVAVSTQADLDAALKDANVGVIVLEKGEYTLPSNGSDYKADLSIVGKGADQTTVNFTTANFNGSNCKNIAIQDVTLNVSEQWYQGFQHSTEETYINCKINGCLVTYAPKVTIKNCEFTGCTGDQYALHLYSGATSEISDCTFTVAEKAAIIYAEGEAKSSKSDATFNNCTFTCTSATASSKVAIEIHSELGSYGTLTINNTTATNFSQRFNGGLWNDIDNTKKDEQGNKGINNYRFDVTVDGVKVQTAK